MHPDENPAPSDLRAEAAILREKAEQLEGRAKQLEDQQRPAVSISGTGRLAITRSGTFARCITVVYEGPARGREDEGDVSVERVFRLPEAIRLRAMLNRAIVTAEVGR